MFTYDELVEYKKKYYFKTDKDTGERKLFDRDSSEFISNSAETTKIMAALSIMNTLGSTEQQYGKLTKAPYETPEEQIDWRREQVTLLQKNLLQILTSGKYTLDEKAFSEMVKISSIDRSFFQTLSYPDKNPEYITDQSVSLMKYLLESNGKKLIDYNIDEKLVGTNRTVDFNFTTKEKTFAEKLNPSNPQYTQPEKPKQATPEQQARRREFAEKLVTYYLMAETDKMYDERVEGEDKNMRFAARAINNSQQIHIEQRDFPKLMRLLLASKNISLDGQTDYFEKIISQPEISKALAEIRDSGQFDKVKSIAERNEQEGKLTNGKLKGHIETKGELGLRIANRTIAQDPGFIEKATRFISSRSKFSVNEQRDAIALSAVARTQGKIPSYTQNENGTFDFNSDEEITR